MKRKLLSILLALSMALTLLPMTALADEGEGGASIPADAVATYTIGSDTRLVGYATTLAEAVAAVPNNGTVYLKQDSSGGGIGTYLNPSVNQIKAKNFTIDFGNHTYTVKNPAVGSNTFETQAFHLEWAGAGVNNYNVTFQNGKIETAAEFSGTLLLQNYCNLTLKNMEIIGGSQIDYVASNNCGNVLIEDSKITAAGGKVAFDVYGGFGSYSDVTVTVKGSSVINGKIEVARGNKMQNENKLIITGGTFNGELSVTANEKTKVSITGGTFDSNVSDYVANGYVQNGNTVEELSDTNAAAQIGGTYYATLAAAYAAATTADIKLLKDAENVELTGQGDKMVTIDLNGHTLTGKITKNHDLTIKDGSDEKNGVAHFDYVQCNVLKLDNGNVTIDDAKILHTVQITGANVTINGGEYRLGGTGHTAAISKTSGSLTVNSGRFWTNHNLGSTDTEVISFSYTYNPTNNTTETITLHTVGKKSQGNYTIKKTGSGNTLYFCDLTTAALAAQDGDTITLLADQTITEPVVVNNSVTIDGGGKNIQLGASLMTSGIVDNYAHGVFQFKGDNKTAAVRNFKFAGIEINTVLLRAYNSGSDSTLTVKDCSFKNIKVMNVIRAASGTAANSKLVVTGCTFEGCTALHKDGNGIIQIDNNTRNATSEIRNNDFIGNKTGANNDVATIYLSAPAKVMNNYFKDNTTNAGSGKNGIVVIGSKAGTSTVRENAFVSHTFTNGDAQGAIYGAKGATTVSKNYYGEGITHLAKQADGFNETDPSTVYLKEVGKTGVKTDLTGVSLTAGTYEYPGDDFASLVASGYRATQGGDGTWTVSRYSSGDGSSSGSTTTKTETTTNPDGSTTKTETKSDGTTVETTTNPDGSTTKTETKKDGSSVTESKDASGSTGTVKTDKDGKTEAEAKISEKAVEDAKQSGEAVKVPTEVKAGESSNSAPTVKIELPENAGETKIEIPVSDVNSGTVAVIVNEDGTEEIVKNSIVTKNGVVLGVEGNTTVKIIDNSKDFIDTRNHWSRDEVNFVAARELFNGVGNNLFGVSGDMTRGMVNTVLARLAGEDTNGGANWYDKGTEWAKKNGITDGTNPTANVTREQLAAMLYRFAGSPKVSGELSFADADQISGYAKDALLWAVQNGILNGIGNNLVAPTAGAERAQVAAMMARYLKNVG